MEDCSDASDEQSCENIVLPDFYPKEEAPPPMGNGTLADILFSIEVIEVLGLDEVQSTMELRYTMTFKWRDSREYRRSCVTFARFADFGPPVATYQCCCQCLGYFANFIGEWILRIKFKTLKAQPFLNTLRTQEATGIWYPKVVFFNTRNTFETKVGQ